MFCFPAMKWEMHGKDEMGKGLSNGRKWWKDVFVISVRQKVTQIIFERAPNGDGDLFFFSQMFSMTSKLKSPKELLFDSPDRFLHRGPCRFVKFHNGYSLDLPPRMLARHHQDY